MKVLKKADLKRLIGTISTDWGYKLLLLVCVLAIFFGSLVASRFTSADSMLGTLTSGFFQERTSSGFFSVFINSLSSALLILLSSFLLGNFNFGCFIVWILPFFKGYGIGTALGFMFHSYGAKGLAYSSMVIIPAAVISSIAIILAAHSSARFSFALFKRLSEVSVRGRVRFSFKDYCHNYMLYVFVCFLAALFEAFMNAVVAGIFDF